MYRQNALDDLLDAERHFRQQAENALRELRGVLVELAQRLAGNQIEDARRADPNAPENWGPETWRAFFAKLPNRQESNGWNENLLTELQQLKGENQALKERLASIDPKPALTTNPTLPELQGELQTPASASPVRKLPAAARLDNSPTLVDANPQPVSFAHVDLLRDLHALPLATMLPARYECLFPKYGLSDADWERQMRRRLYVLYLLSRGMDLRLEIDYLLSQVEGIKSRTGALHRIYDSLIDRKLISREVMEMSAPNTSLALLRLSDEGRSLCQMLGWYIAETERQRIYRLNHETQVPQHTLAVMIFAMHARFRGYRVGVLPQVDIIQTDAVPDVVITRDATEGKPETIYVEVELNGKELDEKWRNLAKLQNRIAICARNTQHRSRLVENCKLKSLHGLATDLETLIACKVPDISQCADLWAEEW